MKIRFCVWLLFLCWLSSCASSKVDSKAEPVHKENDLFRTLDGVPCPNADDFRGIAVSFSESAALAQARSNMALEYFSYKIKANIQIIGQNIDQISSTATHTSMEQEVVLMNSQDAKLHYSTSQGENFGVVVCMSKKDAAKGFEERLRLVADTMSLVSHVLPGIKHPKQKNEAWHRVQILWTEIKKLQEMLDGFGAERTDLFETASELFLKTRDSYKEYCQAVRLYWNPEQKNVYSEMAFAALSKELRFEKAQCKDNGISLVYKNDVPNCSAKYGLHSCSGNVSLSVGSCDGAEYLLLENAVDGAHQKPDFALERMQGRLRTADFWEKWIQEIQLWRPSCE